MEIYLAPLEGVTGYILRGAIACNFANIDKYYTPFVSATKGLSKKQKKDLCPENNAGMVVVPQIMTNKAEDVPYMMELFRAFGYDNLNINLGCPSGTVTSKKRGSGFLLYPDELLEFLDGVYSTCDFPVSIKTRIGYNDASEWEKLLEIYARFPISELTIHPRTRMEFYGGVPHYDAFAMAYDRLIDSEIKLCYNGDINTYADYQMITTRFPKIDRIMIGRGLLRNPGLAEVITRDGSYDAEDMKERFKAFLLELYESYIAGDCGEKDAIGRMKEIMVYMLRSFEGYEDYQKLVMKAQSIRELKVAINQVFSNCELKL